MAEGTIVVTSTDEWEADVDGDGTLMGCFFIEPQTGRSVSMGIEAMRTTTDQLRAMLLIEAERTGERTTLDDLSSVERKQAFDAIEGAVRGRHRRS